MNNARWQQIEELYHAAQAVPAAARAAWLDEHCGTDAKLRRELESLLASHEQAAQGFIAEPAFAAVAAALAETQTGLTPGQQLGNYQILKPLGAGGMGEVYLARDERLGRQIALKILPPLLAADAEWMRRFQQEARTASALNHPNILTVHEIGQAEGVTYLATELVEGETLRARLQNGPLPLPEVLDIARQIASALQAAHEAGVIHRDIKPENLMIRRDGYVKVLDFGIAKTIGPAAAVTDSKSPHTQTGAILGTAPYVSPEQARGEKDIDARSDLFSLGTVLYEMIAGCAPFTKPSFAETLGAILYTEPPPLSERCTDVPESLQHIVKRALRKDTAERYQTAREFHADLTQLKRELESQPPVAVAKVSRHKPRLAARPPLSVWHKPATLAALLFLVAGLVAGWFWYRASNVKPPAFQAGIRKLTSSGKVRRAALSPAGNYFVYVEEEEKKQNLLFRQVNGVQAYQIAEPAEVSYRSLNYSPDGEFIYVVRQPLRTNRYELYRVRAAGGGLELLAEGLSSPVALAPDGKRLAFTRQETEQKRRVLLLANADGSGETPLVTHSLEDEFCVEGIAWSPDAKTIACSAKYKEGAGELVKVTTVRVSDGQERPLSATDSLKLRVLNGMSWLADSSGLLVTAAERASIPIELYHLAFPSGRMTKILSALGGDLRDVTLDKQMRQLLTVKNTWITNLWVVTPDPLGKGPGQVAQVTNGTDTIYDASWTPDGNLIASIVINGQLDLWRLDAAGKNRQQLTFGPYPNFRARPTRDGRYIIYVSNEKGTYNIWRINADGGNKKQLTFGAGEFLPQVTPDSQWVYFGSDASGQRTIWKVSINGGLPSEVLQQPSRNPVISPNGQLLACDYLENRLKAKWQTAVLPINGGAPLKLFNLPESYLRWHPSNRALTYYDTNEQRRNLFLQYLDEAQPRQLTRFDTEGIYYLDWSPDGKRVVLVRGTNVFDVMLLQN